jgi:hypothetical protein
MPLPELESRVSQTLIRNPHANIGRAGKNKDRAAIGNAVFGFKPIGL